MTVRTRLGKLERALPPRGEGPCPWPGVTAIIGTGEPVPEDAGRCPVCGEPHVLVIEVIIEEPPAQGTAAGPEEHR
jgi:hypothetical protein